MTSKVCVEYGARSVFEMMTACRVFRTLFWSGSCCHLCNFLADNWYRLLNRTRGQNSIWNSYNSLIKTLHFNLFFQETLLFRFKMVFFILTLKESLIVLIFDVKFFIVLFCPRFLFNNKHLWQYLKFLTGNTDNTTVPAILLSVFTLLLTITCWYVTWFCRCYSSWWSCYFWVWLRGCFFGSCFFWGWSGENCIKKVTI